MLDQEIIQRAAKAITQAGSREFTGNAGATQAVMSDFALEGKLEALATTFDAHVALHPADRRSLLRRVPRIVSDQYFCRHRGYMGMKVERWLEANPGWEDSLRRALASPARFAFVTNAMADEIRDACEA